MKTYWHNHPRGFANECNLCYAETREEQHALEKLGYTRLTLAEVRAHIRWINAENDSWGSGRAFGRLSLDNIQSASDMLAGAEPVY